MGYGRIQNHKDERNINIKKVGVKGIKYPIIVLDRANGIQHVNATINMYVNLPHHFKGTHMSRFVEVLNEFRGQINIKTYQVDPRGDKGQARCGIRPHGNRVPVFHREDGARFRRKEPDGIHLLVLGPE